MLLLNMIFWVGLLPMVPALPMFHSCEADDCRIGTAVGAGYCGTVTSMGGAIKCAVSFGLECEVTVGVGGICATAGAMGDAAHRAHCAACGKCESKSYPEHMRNFKLLSQKIEDIKTKKGDQIRWFQQLWANDKKQLLKDGQSLIIKNQQSLQRQNKIARNELEQFEALQKLQRGQEIIVQFQLKNLAWFQQLNSNDQKLLQNQASLITLHENTLGKVNELLSNTEKISNEIDRNQILTIYGDTLLKLANIKYYFNNINYGKGNLIINDRTAIFFRDIALDPHDGLEANINNMFKMLQGGGPLNTRSIYEKLGNEYCKPEAHQYFIELQYESFLLYSIALAMDGHSASQQVINSFKQDLVSSTSAYIRNCGCPDNFMKSRRGEVSKLLQNLPESRESVIQNFVKIAPIENKHTRMKMSQILEMQNIDINSDSINIVEEHPWEDIKFVVQLTKNKKSEELELHNFAEICIARDKNDACEVLWTGPSPSQTFVVEMSDLNPVASDYEVADPPMDTYGSVFQEVEGKIYGCNHEECEQYIPEENTWTTIKGSKFVSKRKDAAGTLVGDKWVVQGGEFGWADVSTAEVWTPESLSWVEAPEFKSPLPVSRHCLVTLDNKLMQIGGYSWASGETSKCFLDGKEVASLKAPRNYHACAVFQGQVWVAGGRVGGGHSLVEIYDPVTNAWREGPQRPITLRDDHPRLVEISDQLFYIGGRSIGKIYRLSPNRDGWEEVADIQKGDKFAAIVMNKIC